jgi:hypothetical protein
VFPSSGEGGEVPTLSGPLEIANLNQGSSFRNVVFSSYLEFRMMEKFKNPMIRLCSYAVQLFGY